MIGKSILRKESKNKVTGSAKYTADFTEAGLLHARLLTSPYAHAKIKAIDCTKAKEASGVHAVITSAKYPILTGSTVEDRPILTLKKVRYFGEPIAIVVANTEQEAKRACQLIHVEYEPLPVINSVDEAIKGKQPLIHEHFENYIRVKEIKPNPNRNIANLVTVRKGNMEYGLTHSDVSAETEILFEQSDHAAMETRSVRAEILANGEVHIHSSSQAPFMIKQLIAKHFKIDENKVIVHTPLVGGAFGGKAAVQLEFLAYIASKEVGGKLVALTNPREEDMVSSPVHIGLKANVTLGASKTGELMMAKIMFLFDSGAYVDEASDITTTAALNCTGPYKINHVHCDSYCVYTNHPYSTSFRGYGHSELALAIERTLDELAKKLKMDPMELRIKNAIKPDDTTPSQALLTEGNIGDTSKCLERLKQLIHWDDGQVLQISDRLIRAKGISALWKTSMSPTDASSGAIITFNKDASINVNVGVVEIGQGTKTALIQILAESMKINSNQIHMKMEIDTQTSPKHWKTVASTGTYMAGNAILEAAEDAKNQLKDNAAYVLRSDPKDLEVAGEKVYLKSNPMHYIEMKKVVHGYKYQNGNTVGRVVIGRGGFIMRHLTNMNLQTGKAIPGPSWTVGAQGVEVEYDRKTHMYKLVKAITVLDVGRVINPKMARGQITGAMNMGLSWASMEGFVFNQKGVVLNNQFRTYKTIRYDENPAYIVELLESPQTDGPYGARGLGEHGVIGMGAALANCLSVATKVSINQLPITPEFIWEQIKGASQ